MFQLLESTVLSSLWFFRLTHPAPPYGAVANAYNLVCWNGKGKRGGEAASYSATQRVVYPFVCLYCIHQYSESAIPKKKKEKYYPGSNCP